MTTAALQAPSLRRAVASHTDPAARAYFASVTKAIDPPWSIAVGADLAYPAVPGRRTTQIKIVNSYLPRLHAAATQDAALGWAFMRVMGLLDRPESLMRPDRLLRVWYGTRHRP